MQIRPAEPSDAETLTKKLWLPLAKEMEEVSKYNKLDPDLDIENTVEHKREKLEEEDSFILIAEENSQPMGYVSAAVQESHSVFARDQRLKIKALFILKEFRRQGIASELLSEIQEYTENYSYDTVELSVNLDNESAKQLYEEHGFETERHKMVKWEK